jgi:hypothetical protein
MNEGEITDTWGALEPTPSQRRRIDARVRSWLDARDSSLTAQWLQLLRINPLAALSFAAVAGCLVLIATPMSWVALSVL